MKKNNIRKKNPVRDLSSSVRGERIGIVGGMGPLAGVYFQKLIIEATPAKKDQDHLEVICYTNSSIPDRTVSLLENGGRGFVDAITKTLCTLGDAGATLAAIPCITAHARILDISNNSPVPVLNVIHAFENYVLDKYGVGAVVGVLATNGTVNERIFEMSGNVRCAYPSPESQREVMELILDIKAGMGLLKAADQLLSCVKFFEEKNIDVVVLGCTEFSLCFEYIKDRSDIPVVDPLQIAAQEIVRRCL